MSLVRSVASGVVVLFGFLLIVGIDSWVGRLIAIGVVIFAALVWGMSFVNPDVVEAELVDLTVLDDIEKTRRPYINRLDLDL